MISAYFILHEDDDFLEEAINSVDKYVDEIIVVDGAYEWVAPFFKDAGLAPEKSGKKTQNILAKYGEKIKYFPGTWRDELHKREFGYSQCSGDLILRIDADEVYQINDDNLQEFIASDKSVAEMEFPLLLTKHDHRQKIGNDRIPRQAFLFKRANISAQEHCGYLWLVLTKEEEERRKKPNWEKNLFHPVVARVAHLTELRTPKVSVNRARFYSLLYTRRTGNFPFDSPIGDIPFNPDERIRKMLSFIEPNEYTTFLQGNDIVCGFPDMNEFILEPVVFNESVQNYINKVYDEYLDEVDARKLIKEHPRTILNSINTGLNITKIFQDNNRKIVINFDTAPVEAHAMVKLLLSQPDQSEKFSVEENIPAHIEGDNIIVDLSNINEHINQAVLYVSVRVPEGHSRITMQAISTLGE